MRILAIYRHYWPDTAPYARILRTILEHAASSGHPTTVYAAQPSYNDQSQPRAPRCEMLGGVEVHRLRLLPERKRWWAMRALNSSYFVARAIGHALTRRYDVIVANSHPPILMGCALRLIKMLTGIPYIYHCQDLHPEAAALVGDVRHPGIEKFLRSLDTATCRQAEHVVVLSSDMTCALTARGLSPKNVAIIDNSAPTIRSSPEPASLLPPGSDITRFLFAGNLGRFQGLERIVEAAHRIAGDTRFQVIFMGDGAARTRLIAQAGALAGRQILFLQRQCEDAALGVMRACDYGIVSLLPGVYRYAYPSKTAAYLAAGCPLVAVVESQSELARMIVENDMGYVASSHAAKDIAEAFVRAVQQRDQWTDARRVRLTQFAADTFGDARMIAAWDQLLGAGLKDRAIRAAA